jgi:GTP-binding protein EngB required for normal cell division
MTTLDRRLEALAEAAELARDRLDERLVDDARHVVEKAGNRLGLGIETTVAALAGPTGAGKSSLFNALAGQSLVEVGRRRPTTSATTAAVWGEVDPALLTWLEVPRRNVIEGGEYDRLVLLDLPDFDSVERDHRDEVDRVVALADLLLWVVDPQKYADAAWHERYVRPLRSYGEAMAIALNQADLLAPDALAACVDDLRRLLAADGVEGAPVIAVSAVTGEGLDTLRRLLWDRVDARTAAAQRLAADVDVSAAALLAQCGEGKAHGVHRDDRERLVSALADAAAVPTVVRAVEAAHRRRGTLAAGWPFVRWLKRLRPDPLRRLRLPETPQELVRTSLPGPTDVQRARVHTAARALADRASSGLPDPWPRQVRAAAVATEDEMTDRLDRAVAGTDLGLRTPLWWRVARVVQKVLAAAVLVGALWLLALVLLSYLRLDDVVPTPEARGLPLPTALLLGGAAAGLALAFLARFAIAAGARRRARVADRALRKRVEEAAEELVIAPVEAELNRRDRLRRVLDDAATTPGRRRRASVMG